MFNSQVIFNTKSAGSTVFCYEMRRVVCGVRYMVPGAVLGVCVARCTGMRVVCVVWRVGLRVVSVFCGARGCV